MKTFFKILFSLILTCFTIFHAHSQEINLKEIYEKNVIYQYGYKYMRNGEVITPKIVNAQLMRFPDSANEYELAKDKLRTANLISFASLVLVIGSVFFIEEKQALAQQMVIAGAGLLIISHPIKLKGYKHHQRSLWLYNRDILLEQY